MARKSTLIVAVAILLVGVANVVSAATLLQTLFGGGFDAFRKAGGQITLVEYAARIPDEKLIIKHLQPGDTVHCGAWVRMKAFAIGTSRRDMGREVFLWASDNGRYTGWETNSKFDMSGWPKGASLYDYNENAVEATGWYYVSNPDDFAVYVGIGGHKDKVDKVFAEVISVSGSVHDTPQYKLWCDMPIRGGGRYEERDTEPVCEEPVRPVCKPKPAPPVCEEPVVPPVRPRVKPVPPPVVPPVCEETVDPPAQFEEESAEPEPELVAPEYDNPEPPVRVAPRRETPARERIYDVDYRGTLSVPAGRRLEIRLQDPNGRPFTGTASIRMALVGSSDKMRVVTVRSGHVGSEPLGKYGEMFVRCGNRAVTIDAPGFVRVSYDRKGVLTLRYTSEKEVQ